MRRTRAIRHRPTIPPVAVGGARLEQAEPPAIRIDIDPAISAGYIHDRYDLLVRGRVVSDVPVEEIAIRLDDAVIGRVQYRQVRSGAADQRSG